MKRTLTAYLLTAIIPLTVSMKTEAAPFAFAKVSSTAADKCVVTGATLAALNGEYAVTDAAYQGQRGCLIDLASVPTGVNQLSIAAKSDVWGVLGAPLPFSFSRPTSSDMTVELIRLVP